MPFLFNVLPAPIHVIRDVEEGQGRVLILQVLPEVVHGLVEVAFLLCLHPVHLLNVCNVILQKMKYK